MAKKRDLRLDNLKCLLIFLVVFCHLTVEAVEPRGDLSRMIYQTVYVFHMPVFVFTTGYFARFRPKRIFAGLVLPYVFFQIGTIVFKNLMAGRVWTARLTLLDPEWTLWYLLACVLWYLTIPLLERATTRKSHIAVCAVSLLASLIAGFVPWLGDILALSRTVALFPFFCAGYFAGRAHLSERVGSLGAMTLRRVRLALLAALLLFLAVQLMVGRVPKQVLYRSEAYESVWDFYGRVLVQIGAVVWCAQLFVSIPTQSQGLATTIGRNTMSVYLLHPWLIRMLRCVFPLYGPEAIQVLLCATIAALTLALLGNDVVGRCFAYVFGGGWTNRTPQTE